MNVDEAEKINAAIKVLEKHGYTEAAEALKVVCLREFQLIAESLHDELPPGIKSARAQRALRINH